MNAPNAVASGLAGYMRTTSDRDLAFAVMITDRKARKRYDARRRGGGEPGIRDETVEGRREGRALCVDGVAALCRSRVRGGLGRGGAGSGGEQDEDRCEQRSPTDGGYIHGRRKLRPV